MAQENVLAELIAKIGTLAPEDQEAVVALAEKYGIELEVEEPEPEPEHEVQESPETEKLEHETNQELGEATGEVVEPKQENGEQEVEQQGEQPDQQEQPMEEVEPQEPQVDPLQMMQEQIVSLSGKVDTLMSLLEKVAIHKPVDDDEVEQEDIGQKSKQTDAKPQVSNAREQLLAKFGGRAY